jgi:hypothetical protein
MATGHSLLVFIRCLLVILSVVYCAFAQTVTMMNHHYVKVSSSATASAVVRGSGNTRCAALCARQDGCCGYAFPDCETISAYDISSTCTEAADGKQCYVKMTEPCLEPTTLEPTTLEPTTLEPTTVQPTTVPQVGAQLGCSLSFLWLAIVKPLEQTVLQQNKRTKRLITNMQLNPRNAHVSHK